MLHKDFGDGSIGKFFYLWGCPLVTHLLYAKDVLGFTNVERLTLKKLLKILEIYGSWSDQDIDKVKFSL